ncbi:hypothetical protein B7494_g1519 [Chlorociboria aeruginascens]|nr:hypothetical protein B7494_g1519 [Chlorociboria aeruginascens]
MESIQPPRTSNGMMNGHIPSVNTIRVDTTSTSSSKIPKAENGENARSSVTSPITAPPYWVQSHQRSVSNISVESIAAGGIRLLDNTSPDVEDSKNKACWAKCVYIEDHVVINGNRTGIGSFVVWNITVETLRVCFSRRGKEDSGLRVHQGGTMCIRKRYSEFDDLRQKLLQTFPNSEAAMPELPPKSLISKFRKKFLENRRAGLQFFLK